MSNAKRIRKRVAKLEKRKYKTFLYLAMRIDAKPLLLAIEKVRGSIEQIVKSARNIKVTHEQL